MQCLGTSLTFKAHTCTGLNFCRQTATPRPYYQFNTNDIDSLCLPSRPCFLHNRMHAFCAPCRPCRRVSSACVDTHTYLAPSSRCGERNWMDCMGTLCMGPMGACLCFAVVVWNWEGWGIQAR